MSLDGHGLGRASTDSIRISGVSRALEYLTIGLMTLLVASLGVVLFIP